MTTETQLQQVHESVTELRRKLDSSLDGKISKGEFKEVQDKIEASLEAYDQKNNELVAKMAAEQNAARELKEKCDSLERQLLRVPVASATGKILSEHMKAFEKMIREDKNAPSSLSVQEMKYLRSDVGPSGGFLCPPEWIAELLKDIVEISPVRQFARKRITNSVLSMQNVRTTIVDSYWEGELADYTASQSVYEQSKIPTNKLVCRVKVSDEVLRFNHFNLEQSFNEDMRLSMAKTEGLAFISGTGVKSPQGLLTNDDVEAFNSGVANDITFDSLINIQGQLKDGYNPSYMMNRRTLAKIRQMKDGVGQYLWNPAVAAGMPSMLNGDLYISAINMPDIGVGTYPVLYGDFYMAYTIEDNLEAFMLRNPYIEDGRVVFTLTRYLGGQVVLPEAMKKLKCSV